MLAGSTEDLMRRRLELALPSPVNLGKRPKGEDSHA
jgi:hypothetical protein